MIRHAFSSLLYIYFFHHSLHWVIPLLGAIWELATYQWTPGRQASSLFHATTLSDLNASIMPQLINGILEIDLKKQK